MMIKGRWEWGRVALLCCGALWWVGEVPRGWAGSVPYCHVNQLDVQFEDPVDKPGTLLVLRNVSHQVCQLTALPEIAFEADGEALTVERRLPASDAGECLPPSVRVAPGDTVVSALSWEERDIARVHDCVTPLMASVILKTGVLRLVFGRQMCTAGGDVWYLSQQPFTPRER